MLVQTFLASLAAKLAVATGVGVASVAAAGATGVLPEPAQHAVASVVEATTPFALPDPSDMVNKVKDDLATTASTLAANDAGELEGDGGDEAGEKADQARKENHGLCVSTVAKNTTGPDKGKTVSSIARSDCGKTTTTTSVAPGSTSSTTSTTVVDSSTTSSTVASAGKGGAKSGSNAGNSGKGNSGKK